MEDKASSLFVNDGSFMERFRKMQEENKLKEPVEESKSGISLTSPVTTPKPGNGSKIHVNRSGTSVGGKLAFSLKQKTKVVAPVVKFGADDDEDEPDGKNTQNEAQPKRQKLNQPEASQTSSSRGAVPTPPSSLEVKKVADKLAGFVAKNGRQFEQITRQKNPGDTPFKFLFDQNSQDYKYYEYRLLEEEKVLQRKNSQPLQAVPSAPSQNQTVSRKHLQDSSYQTPASALYESEGQGEGNLSVNADPIAVMEFYMKKAAHEERKRQPKQSKDEMPPPASLQVTPKKGHHMGDYIPPEELAKFLSTCNDAAARKAAVEAAERNKIQADNVGHKLLSKMGWKEGEGLGSSKSGRFDPVMAGSVKQDTLGVGASRPGEVTPEDDIYEQYKKRMMLGYRYRPNPLNNPRKAYY